MLVGSRGPGPLDQPEAARQRDGLVLDGPTVSPTVAGVHLPSLPNVLLFVRDPPSVVPDPEGRLAAAVGLPRPVDGGPGVGYAVVDADGVVRYSTLDPAWADNAFEVATILGATS